MTVVGEKNHLPYLVDKLTFNEKVERSLALIENACQEFGDSLVVANSLGKDSVAVWHGLVACAVLLRAVLWHLVSCMVVIMPNSPMKRSMKKFSNF